MAPPWGFESTSQAQLPVRRRTVQLPDVDGKVCLVASNQPQKIYEGDGDRLMAVERAAPGEHIVMIPDAMPGKVPDATPHIRIMWGQHLLEDLVLGRYRSLVCAVNTRDNSRGIIGQLAALLPTTQWNEQSVTAYALRFSAGPERVKIIKYEMDMLEVLAILRPPGAEHLTVDHLASAFRIISEMIRHRTTRLPAASVSFLGARANALVDERGAEPSFETVLRVMYEAGFHGDVYPAPAMWSNSDLGVYPRYPFPAALDQMRAGGS
jgi:hypothetical protein